MTELDVRPLTSDTWAALARLFEVGGDARTCWCQFWRVPASTFSNTSVDENRERLRAQAAGDGGPPGLVALRGGEAVGWVSLGPREVFERLHRSRTIPQPPGDEVWSIVCFVVGRASRRTGVGSALLAAAVEHARANGARTLEAYPVMTAGAKASAASLYTGTVSMFERAGFTIVSETASRAGGGFPRVLVRRELSTD